jgi:hypothetical protein
MLDLIAENLAKSISPYPVLLHKIYGMILFKVLLANTLNSSSFRITMQSYMQFIAVLGN